MRRRVRKTASCSGAELSGEQCIIPDVANRITPDYLRSLGADASDNERTALLAELGRGLDAIERLDRVILNAIARFGPELSDHCTTIALGFLTGYRPETPEQMDGLDDVFVFLQVVENTARRRGVRREWTGDPEKLLATVRSPGFIGGALTVRTRDGSHNHMELLLPGLGIQTEDALPDSVPGLLGLVHCYQEGGVDTMVFPEKVIARSISLLGSNFAPKFPLLALVTR